MVFLLSKPVGWFSRHCAEASPGALALSWKREVDDEETLYHAGNLRDHESFAHRSESSDDCGRPVTLLQFDTHVIGKGGRI